MQERPWMNEHGQVMKRLELHLTYTCPERCVFCSEEHRMQEFRQFPVTWGRVVTILRMHAERGVENVHFTGGEPTIHPRFLDILRVSKKLRMRTSIGTIGTMLAKDSFAQEVLPFLDEALFSIHGASSDIHDMCTRRTGSFIKSMQAIDNCTKYGQNFGLYVNTVVTNLNVHNIPETVEMVDGLGAQLMVISNTTPEGLGFDNYKELAVSLEKLQDMVEQILEKKPKMVVRFFGFPMCILSTAATWSNDIHWSPRVTVEWSSTKLETEKIVSFDGVYSWKPDRKRVHVPTCTTCSRKEICMGVFDKYTELWDTTALVPYT